MTLGLAVGNLILLPFGTALGVYALWVLLKDEGRRLFEPNHLNAAPRWASLPARPALFDNDRGEAVGCGGA